MKFKRKFYAGGNTTEIAKRMLGKFIVRKWRGKKTIGKIHPSYALHLTSLAKVLWKQGHYQSAEELLRKVLEIDKKTIGGVHPIYSEHLMNLAEILQLQGGHQEAKRLYQRALEISSLFLGCEHHQTATIREKLDAMLGTHDTHIET